MYNSSPSGDEPIPRIRGDEVFISLPSGDNSLLTFYNDVSGKHYIVLTVFRFV